MSELSIKKKFVCILFTRTKTGITMSAVQERNDIDIKRNVSSLENLSLPQMLVFLPTFENDGISFENFKLVHLSLSHFNDGVVISL